MQSSLEQLISQDQESTRRFSVIRQTGNLRYKEDTNGQITVDDWNPTNCGTSLPSISPEEIEGRIIAKAYSYPILSSKRAGESEGDLCKELADFAIVAIGDLPGGGNYWDRQNPLVLNEVRATLFNPTGRTAGYQTDGTINKLYFSRCCPNYTIEGDKGPVEISRAKDHALIGPFTNHKNTNTSPLDQPVYLFHNKCESGITTAPNTMAGTMLRFEGPIRIA